MTREAAEAIVRAEFATQYGVELVVRQVVDEAYEEPDREWIAASLWTSGAGAKHEGCIYGPPEPSDADYENGCETCQEYLLGLADQILAALAEPTGEEKR